MRNRFFGPKYPSLPWISYRATERQRSLLRRLDPSPSPAIHAAPSRIPRRRRRRPRASPDPTPPSRVQELSSWLRRPGGMRAAQSRSGVRAAALRGTLAGISCGRVPMATSTQAHMHGPCLPPPAGTPTNTTGRQPALGIHHSSTIVIIDVISLRNNPLSFYSFTSALLWNS